MICLGFLTYAIQLFNDYKKTCRIVSKQEIGIHVRLKVKTQTKFRWEFAEWRNETARAENRGGKKWNLTIKGKRIIR